MKHAIGLLVLVLAANVFTAVYQAYGAGWMLAAVVAFDVVVGAAIYAGLRSGKWTTE